MAQADPLATYNVVWDSPSADHNGSMPIGNGDIGVNVWAEKDGDLLLLLSKTDAWSENGRLLKLGRVRVKLSPNPFSEGVPFRQELRLRQGEITISSGEGDKAINLRLWVDANKPVVRLEAESDSRFDMQAALEVWRTEPRELTGNEIQSIWGMRLSPSPIIKSADTVLTDQKNRVTWYHRNERSVWRLNLEHQGMAAFIAESEDPLLNRTFGGVVLADGLTNSAADTLTSAVPRKRFELSIHPLCRQTETVDLWLGQLNEAVARNDGGSLDRDRQLHREWWEQFWNRSWVRVTGDADAEAVTRGYTLQRWVSACGGRGRHPIKFNGSIFTVDGGGCDADFRRWGGCYWWQNTRLPYWPMLASGDFDMMHPLFRMYQEMQPLAEARTRTWFGHDGSFIGETVHFWGMYGNRDYGWKRPKGLPVGELTEVYIRREYTASLELLAMMLDYYRYTGDERFLEKSLLPLSDSLLAFWDQHYKLDEKDHLKMYPAQALETLQDAENPTPDIAGLKWVLQGLLELGETRAGAGRRKFWEQLLAKVPPIPMQGDKRILGAKIAYQRRRNTENPELYAVFPFRHYGVGKPGLDVGRFTYERRRAKGNNGWRQDDTQAAFLGLTETAKKYIAGRAKNKHTESRFPAFWGPNFDWIPDQCHGGNLLMGLQTMILQADDGKIMLLPAWPKQWDVDFRLHAPQRTIVEGRVEKGRLVDLKVTPESRRKDVVIDDE